MKFKKINSWSHLKKSWVLWVIFLKEGSILWVVLLKSSILWVVWLKFNSLSHFLKPFFSKTFFEFFFCKKKLNSVSHIFWTRPDDRMIIPVKFQIHRINDLIHQDQTEKAKHWKKTNNSRKKRFKMDLVGIRCATMADPNTMLKIAVNFILYTAGPNVSVQGISDGVACHSFLVRVWTLVLVWFKVACRNVFLRIFPWRQTTSPHNQLPTRILRQKGWGSPRLLVPTFRSRRLCRQINCTSQHRKSESAVAAQQ